MSASASSVLLTAEDLPYVMPHEERCELVAGEVIREPLPGEEHGCVAATIVILLGQFVRDHGLGRVYDHAGFVVARDPDTVRGPDAAFVSAERSAATVRRGPFFEGAPDLAVEVLSPGNTRREIATKIGEYLAAGGRAVWVVDPRRRTVTVHRPEREPETVSRDEVLDGGTVLPGFRLPVVHIFEV
jgi:Uma2 family endonuclease